MRPSSYCEGAISPGDGSDRIRQPVERGLRNAGAPQSLAHRALERLVAHMVSPLDAASWIKRATIGEKDVLPAPIGSSVRVFSFERRRQPDGAESGSKVARMKLLGIPQMHAEWLDETLGKHRKSSPSRPFRCERGSCDVRDRRP